MIRVPDIVAAVADATGLTVADLKGRSQAERTVTARHLAMWLAWTHCRHWVTQDDIAHALGRASGTAVRFGLPLAERRLAASAEHRLTAELALALASGEAGDAQAAALDRLAETEPSEEPDRDAVRSARTLALARRAEARASAALGVV
jgi:Bacterial dnaA protein helix-turn-helix